MRFVVPQFIDVEDKIIGPISVRQFVIFLVAAVVIFIEYSIFSFIWFIIIGLMTFGLSGIIAFAKINGQAFHYFLLNIIYTIRKPSLKVWSKEAVPNKEKVDEKKHVKTTVAVEPKKIATSSKLTRLSLMVDTGGAFDEDEEEIAFKV